MKRNSFRRAELCDLEGQEAGIAIEELCRRPVIGSAIAAWASSWRGNGPAETPAIVLVDYSQTR